MARRTSMANSKGGFSGCHWVPKNGWCLLSMVDTYSNPFLQCNTYCFLGLCTLKSEMKQVLPHVSA